MIGEEAIGGYFGLEMECRTPYHKNAIALNAGRFAFEYILKKLNPLKVWIPYYRCNSLIEALSNLNIPYESYKINKQFLPKEKLPVEKGEYVLYTNYFGLCEKQQEILKPEYDLIVDLTQAFFQKFEPGQLAFNSARKFFGVPDGAYCSNLGDDGLHGLKVHQPIFTDYLIARASGRIEEGYASFQKNEDSFKEAGMARMSPFSTNILRSLDYNLIAEKRRSNFSYLDQALGHFNELSEMTVLSTTSVPMTYPLLMENGAKIKKELIARKIFVPTLWPEVLGQTAPEDFENRITRDTLFLPIDHRYDEGIMKYIVSKLESIIKKL